MFFDYKTPNYDEAPELKSARLKAGRAWTNFLKRNSEYEAELRNIDIQCGGCQSTQKLGETPLKIETVYVPPRGCSEGDYHTPSGNYLLTCTSCKESLLLKQDHPLAKLSHLFKRES